MSFSKKVFIDNETVIDAEFLNGIQDEVRRLGTSLPSDELITSLIVRARELGLIGNDVTPDVLREAKITELKDGWKFTKGTSVSYVSLPHTCNTADGMSSSMYRGATEYEKTIISAGKSLMWLVIEGAGQKSEVFLDGTSVYTYFGGYTHYAVPLGIPSLGNHVLKIRCDNSVDFNNIPVSADFNFNNGLHRTVWLIELGTSSFDPEKYGQDRFHLIEDSVSEESASFRVKAKIIPSYTGCTVRFKLKDALGNYVITDEFDAVSAEYERSFTLSAPHLWNGKSDPYLYTASLELIKEESVIDTAEARIGFRYFSLDAECGFRLNGQPYPLRGVCLHQDTDSHMSAMTEADFDHDYADVDEIGATVVRLAHYPHSRYAFGKCDEMGLVVQTEIPWVNQCGVNASDEYFENIKINMASMIKNYFNHPSIIFWGMCNELSVTALKGVSDQQGSYSYEKANAWVNELYTYSKALDPGRLIGFVSCDGTLVKTGGSYSDIYQNATEWHVDWLGTNQYNGWYGGTFEKFGRVIDKYHATVPYLCISEYGAGANPANHKDYPAGTNVIDESSNSATSKHYEEFQSLFHESHLEQILARGYLVFTTIWILFDFAVAGRNEGGIPYTNDKGLINRSRQIKKDSFYLYKAAWSSSPTAYITSRRYTNRIAGDISVKAYANTDNLSLYVDGVLKQTMTEPTKCGVVWEFDAIEFEDGTHTVTVRGTKGGEEVSDTIEWNVIEELTPLVITSQPQDTSCNVGETATFSVSVSGGLAPYTYRWLFAASGSSTFTNATGADDGTNAVFTTSERSMQNNGARYRCTITDSLGVSVTSEPGTLTVLNNATDFALSDSFDDELALLDVSLNTTATSQITYTPSGATEGKNIVWTSTPSGVVDVSQSGSVLTVTALAEGTATITGTLENGVSHSYTATVSETANVYRLEYDLTKGDATIVNPTVGNVTATLGSDVDLTSSGMIPRTQGGNGAFIIPLDSGIWTHDHIRITMDYGAFNLDALDKDTLEGKALFSLVDSSDNLYSFVLFKSATNENRFQNQLWYNHGQVKYNPASTNTYYSFTKQQYIIDIDTTSGEVTLNCYGGTDNFSLKGTTTVTYSGITASNRLILANKFSMAAAVPIHVERCAILAY